MADRTISSRLMDGINYLLLSLIAAACVIPFIYILAAPSL